MKTYDKAVKAAIASLKHSQAGISGRRVGASVIASNGARTRVFSGCNIELATSTCFHAERVALLKAISEGYTDIQSIFVTSLSKEQRAALCGYCRQDFMYANRNCMIYVLNPDATLKIKTRLVDTLKYPYLGGGKLDVARQQ